MITLLLNGWHLFTYCGFWLSGLGHWFGTRRFKCRSDILWKGWARIITQFCLVFLVNDQHDAQILFYVFISIYNSLHVTSTSCSSSGETHCINTASGNSHSMLVAEMCADWKKTSSNLHTPRPPTKNDTRGCIDAICLSWWWALYAWNK